MKPEQKISVRLLFLAAASLYLELAVIRFTSAEVLYLGYFSNLILITAFLGLGLGFLSAKRKLPLTRLYPFVLLFLFALVLVSPFDVRALKDRHGLHFFGNIEGQAGLSAPALLSILALTSIALFATVGRMVGQVFTQLKPLRAYTFDIAGSLLGIALFSMQSMFWSGPSTWVLTATLLLCIGYLLAPDPAEQRRAIPLVLGAVAVVVLLLSSGSGDATWSTYQKLELKRRRGVPPTVLANSIPHQLMRPAKMAARSYYGLPWNAHKKAGGELGEVLIIGAGTGTDVSVGLFKGAKTIDAVEIDEGIFEVGQRDHPDRPYDSPMVNMHVADGREFLQRKGRSYDLIIFALPDSLMKVSPNSNVRLESYLFTMESLADAKKRLKPGGTLALYNQYRWPWLRDRISGMLTRVFGRAPLRVEVGQTTVFIVGDRIPPPTSAPTIADYLPTDDWPFVYMQEPGLHWLYLGMIGGLLIFAAVGVKLLAPAGTLSNPDWPFFLMGAAFLLLETKSIAFFSLLFGTTWIVNSAAFFGILCSVLLANLVVSRWKIRHRSILFAALFAALLVAYLVPSGALLSLDSTTVRYSAAIALAFSPIFFANLVFSREFRDTEEGTRAFGWNLLGAVAGGGLEYLSLLTGQRNLLFIVAGCYLLVALLLRRTRPATA